MSELKLTHIGGPTVLLEVGGWRLLTDPTFDPPGGSYRFGWGTGSMKMTGPRSRGRARPDRRRPPQPRPPRRQPRSGGAELFGDVGTVVTTVPGPSASAARHAASATGRRRRWRRRPAPDRDHGNAMPPRPAPEPADRWRRDRLRASRRWGEGGEGVIWVSGDTVLYPGVREVATGSRWTSPCSTSAACSSP